MMRGLSRLLGAVAVTVPSPNSQADEPAPVSYFRDVRPIVQQHCQGCHQPAKAGGSYVMTDYAALIKPGESGKPAIVPGKPGESHLLAEIAVTDGKAEMPKNRPPLSESQIRVIAEWVRQGAADDTPESARAVTIDADRPPVYKALPVVPALAYSPDGRRLAVAGYHEILLHDADSGEIAGRLVGMSERVQSLAFSPDGRKLAAAAGDPGRFGEVQIWDVDKFKLLVSAPLTYDTLYGISWRPDGSMVAVGCTDNTVRGLDPTNGRQTLQMGTHTDWVLGTAFSRDGKHLVSVSRDMTLKLTEVATERFIDNVTSITPGALKGGLMTLDVRPRTLRWYARVPTDDGKRQRELYDEVLVGGSDGTPRLYKMHREKKRVIGDDANRQKEYEPMPGRLNAVAFSPDGQLFAAASSLDGTGEVRVYGTDTGAKLTCEGVTGPVYAVAWRPDGAAVASAGFDGVVWLHDPDTGKLIKSFPAAPLTAESVSR